MNSTAYENLLAYISTQCDLSDSDKIIAEDLLYKVWDEAYDAGFDEGLKGR